MTPHIGCNNGDIAPLVLMPGDPLRAKYIVGHYLSNVKLVSEVRGMCAYTGEYHGKKVSVMASGMGNPSMGIYSYELYKFFGVQKIIRIGTCGAYTEDLNLNDIILVDKVYSHSTYALVLDSEMNSVLEPSKELNNAIIDHAGDIKLHVGTIYNTDAFYSTNSDFKMLVEHHACLGVEMESFALCANAKHFNKECAILLTVSDSFVKEGILTSEEREKGLDKMIELALKSI